MIFHRSKQFSLFIYTCTCIKSPKEHLVQQSQLSSTKLLEIVNSAKVFKISKVNSLHCIKAMNQSVQIW